MLNSARRGERHGAESFAPSGARRLPTSVPRACDRGCILKPLRGGKQHRQQSAKWPISSPSPSGLPLGEGGAKRRVRAGYAPSSGPLLRLRPIGLALRPGHLLPEGEGHEPRFRLIWTPVPLHTLDTEGFHPKKIQRDAIIPSKLFQESVDGLQT